jgi:hypothetical protein
LKKKRVKLLHRVVQVRLEKRQAESILNPKKEIVHQDDIDYESLFNEFEEDVDSLEMLPTIVRKFIISYCSKWQILWN